MPDNESTYATPCIGSCTRFKVVVDPLNSPYSYYDEPSYSHPVIRQSDGKMISCGHWLPINVCDQVFKLSIEEVTDIGKLLSFKPNPEYNLRRNQIELGFMLGCIFRPNNNFKLMDYRNWYSEKDNFPTPP